MKEIVKNLESKVTELEAKDVQVRDKVNELELRDVEMREKVTELEDKIAQQDSTCYERKTNAPQQQPIHQQWPSTDCHPRAMISK